MLLELLLASWLTAQAGVSTVEAELALLPRPEAGVEAMEALVLRGADAVPSLARVAGSEEADLLSRGRAVLVLSRIGGPEAGAALSTVADQRGSDSVRIWASAAEILACDTPSALHNVMGRRGRIAGLDGAVTAAAMRLFPGPSAESFLVFSAVNGEFGSALLPVAQTFSTASLVDAMFRSRNSRVRFQAAGLLGARVSDRAAIIALLVDHLNFRYDEAPPWGAQSLMLPNLRYTEDEARELLAALLPWYLSLADDPRQQRRAENVVAVLFELANLGPVPEEWSPDEVLRRYGRAVGFDSVREIQRQVSP